MSHRMIKQLRHRIRLGRLVETENEEGRITRSFRNSQEMWASIKSMPLTNCLPFGGSNERTRRAKGLYKIRIRASSMLLVQQKNVNAAMWKSKVLVTFSSFCLDETMLYLDGLFYDFGQEIEND